MFHDLRYALRTIAKNKAFFAVIVFILALGIGANTAVFSIVHEVILKPLPFRDPSRLLAVWDTYLPQFSKVGVSPPELVSWQSQRDLFEATAWYRYVPLDGNLIRPGTEPFAVHADFISADLFPMLGMHAATGRTFKSEEHAQDGRGIKRPARRLKESLPCLAARSRDLCASTEDPHSVLLGDRLWRARFGGDRRIIGQTIRFNDEQFTIVGVMPPEAQFPDWADFWLPNGPLLADQLTNPVRHALGFIARLQPRVSTKQAAARLADLSQQLAREHPQTSTGWGIRVSGLQEDLTGDVRPALLLLLGAASLLLLIACANIANLLLARASGRAKEMAVRAAVGGTAFRISRQLVTENLVLALFGGAFGWVLAKTALAVTLPTRAHMEPRVILFLGVISALTGVLFGLAPVLQALRSDPQSVIKSGSVTNSGATSRSVLVVFEFALTLMLVIGAAILARSFTRLMQVNPGFEMKGVLTIRILAPPSRNPAQLFRLIQQKFSTLPGVRKVAITNALPLMADRANTSRFNVPGSPLIKPEALPAAQIRTASPDYFAAMKIALKSGRTFTERDLNQPVVIINETMAKRFWPGRDAVGIKFITGPWGPNPTWSTIVGVVADVKQFGLESEPSFDFYYPSLAGQYLIVKTWADPIALGRVAEKTIHSIDPELAISNVRSMDEIASESARTRRWTMGLLLAFATMALLLALVGIYGIMAWSVAQRTREVGIRMALGAQGHQVLRPILLYGMKLASVGSALGIVASFALRDVLSSLVFAVSTIDPVVYISVPALMFLVALLACYFPARKAATVDPLVSLRYE